MIVLGLETSCDETSAALVDHQGRVLSNIIHSQIARHQPYGGVVPELASRCHVENLPAIVREAVRQAGLHWADIDAVAVTRGPGLISSLLVGLTAAKALAVSLQKPLLGVNHMEAHLHAIFLGGDQPPPEDACPLLALMVSGGHTSLVWMEGPGRYRLLGQTLDDAAGEALDKGAKLMGLGYPGGPLIEKAALGGRTDAIPFPRGMRRKGEDALAGELNRAYCFSFSGLKTSLRYHLRDYPITEATQLPDIAASYQEAVFDMLLGPAQEALRKERPRTFACVGGVARNQRLRGKMEALAQAAGVPLRLAKMEYCTDNAAMVAGLAARGGGIRWQGGIDLEARPVLPMASDEITSQKITNE